jgi:hypothetical protein
MSVELDTFLVALYTIVDDRYREHVAAQRPRRRGGPPRLSDSEVLVLTLCAQWYGPSERSFLRFVARYWGSYFPDLLDQSAFNRRVRDLTGVLTQLVPLVAAELGAALTPYQVFDGVGVPLARRCRGQRHRLFAHEAAIGRGGVDKDWYFGCHLLLSCTPAGVVTGFVAGPANTEGRWLADALCCWRADPAAFPWDQDDLPPSHHRGGRVQGPTGPIWPRDGAGRASPAPYLADNGFRGVGWSTHWRIDYAARILTADTYPGDAAPQARRQHHGWRQIIETVNGILEQTLHLHFPGARSFWGLRARLAAKLLALNLGIWLNTLFERDPLALDTLFPA